ncbi:MAG: zinc metallopeptidase [Spirochaetales bacterium]|nr:zinc metallopeptidase [Spirochaetales bacterium]
MFDPLYFILVMPFFLLSMWASYRVNSSFKKWAGFRNSYGYTGAEIARRILNQAGLASVKVEHVPGSLTDHYDPSSKTLRLSDDTFSSNSIAAAGVAAHEAGHAIQDQVRYPMLAFRSAVVPMASFSSKISTILIMAGFLLMMFMGPLGWYIAAAGVVLFSIVVVFQLITVPVELDASRRAKEILQKMGMASRDETVAVNEVLNAAAWTYVAAALAALAQLVYFALRLLMGSRDE